MIQIPIRLFLVCLLSLPFLTACDKIFPIKVDQFYGQTMGTSYSVSISGLPSNISKNELKDGIHSILEDINQKMSTYREDSDISRINNSELNQWVEISKETYEVIKEGLIIAELSDGAFEMTIGPVVNLWGFGPENQPEQVPESDEIKTALQKIGPGFIQLHESQYKIKKTGDIYLDLSAIAKGYAVDRVANYLLGKGIENALIEVGGELKSIGQKKPDRLWRVAIEAPTENLRSVHKVIEIKNAGLATSGDYRNYFEVDGRRYSHTLDPKTGYPINHKLASVSVIASDCMLADALATALLVLGEEKGKEFAKKNDISAYFIIKTKDGFKEFYSGAFNQYVIKEP